MNNEDLYCAADESLEKGDYVSAQSGFIRILKNIKADEVFTHNYLCKLGQTYLGMCHYIEAMYYFNIAYNYFEQTFVPLIRAQAKEDLKKIQATGESLIQEERKKIDALMTQVEEQNLIFLFDGGKLRIPYSSGQQQYIDDNTHAVITFLKSAQRVNSNHRSESENWLEWHDQRKTGIKQLLCNIFSEIRGWFKENYPYSRAGCKLSIDHMEHSEKCSILYCHLLGRSLLDDQSMINMYHKIFDLYVIRLMHLGLMCCPEILEREGIDGIYNRSRYEGLILEIEPGDANELSFRIMLYTQGKAVMNPKCRRDYARDYLRHFNDAFDQLFNPSELASLTRVGDLIAKHSNDLFPLIQLSYVEDASLISELYFHLSRYAFTKKNKPNAQIYIDFSCNYLLKALDNQQCDRLLFLNCIRLRLQIYCQIYGGLDTCDAMEIYLNSFIHRANALARLGIQKFPEMFGRVISDSQKNPDKLLIAYDKAVKPMLKTH